MTRSIEVTATPNSNGWTCSVRIEVDGRKISDHTVEATRSDVERFAPGSLPPWEEMVRLDPGPVDDLVRRTFEFLLDREPPQSILTRFSLADVERYFPDYPRVIGA